MFEYKEKVLQELADVIKNIKQIIGTINQKVATEKDQDMNKKMHIREIKNTIIISKIIKKVKNHLFANI